MIVDCSDCLVRDVACGDCVVTVLLGTPAMPSSASAEPRGQANRISIDQEELGAIGLLAEVGMVPRLRLVVSDREADSNGPLSARDTSSGKRAM